MYIQDFVNKKNFELVTKYLGKMPCDECLVRATCFNATINDDDGLYDICLNQPCDEARIWLNEGVPLGRYLSWFKELNNQLLESLNREEIMKGFKVLCEAMSYSIEK